MLERSVRSVVAWIVALSAAFTAAAAGPPPVAPEATPGRRVPDLPLRGTDGRLHRLSSFLGRRGLVIVFLGTECPMSNRYAPILSAMASRYRERGVRFLGVYADPEVDGAKAGAHAREFALSFPVARDERQALADFLNARTTPEAFLLDSQRIVRYRGRIDDRFVSRTLKRDEPTSRDLQAALDAVLAGRPVPRPVTPAPGCLIARPQRAASGNAAVTYYRDVAPILQERCQSCHRPGQIGPFSLLTYADARRWAPLIREVTQSRQMPPWKAEPGYGDFLDVRRLTDRELATLAAWVEAGTPEGDPRGAPAPRTWSSDWMLGKPDLVLTMPEPFSIEATGPDVFQCFVLPTGLTEDREVVAVEIRPGNPRVTHHVLNFIDTSGRARELDAKHPGPGYPSGPGGIGFLPAGGLGGWAPGNLPRFLPPGVGRPLPKGADLVIQMHYHKTGKPETDRTSIGLYFAREPIRKRLRVWPFASFAIDIPPGEPRHEIRAEMTVPMDVEVLAVTPHMHLLGKEMKLTATLPDGTVQPMIWIRDWDYRWQDTYRYREPVRLPRGTRLELVAYYDNSEANPLNPSRPPRRVRFGEQTTDEMCFAFLEYVLEREPADELELFRSLLFGR